MRKFKWLTPSEKEIEGAILDFLNHQPGVLAFKVQTKATYNEQGGFYMKLPKGVLPGTPDIIACIDELFVGFEVKTEKGRQSPDQKEFERVLKTRTRGRYFVVRSIMETEAALSQITGDLFAKGVQVR